MTTSPTTTCSMCAKRPCTRASERSRPILAPRPRTSRAWAALGPIPRRRPTVPVRASVGVLVLVRARARRLRLGEISVENERSPTFFVLIRKRQRVMIAREVHPVDAPVRRGGGIAAATAASVAIVAGPNPCGSTMSARCLRVALKIHRAASHASESGECAPPRGGRGTCSLARHPPRAREATASNRSARARNTRGFPRCSLGRTSVRWGGTGRDPALMRTRARDTSHTEEGRGARPRRASRRRGNRARGRRGVERARRGRIVAMGRGARRRRRGNRRTRAREHARFDLCAASYRRPHATHRAADDVLDSTNRSSLKPYSLDESAVPASFASRSASNVSSSSLAASRRRRRSASAPRLSGPRATATALAVAKSKHSSVSRSMRRKSLDTSTETQFSTVNSGATGGASSTGSASSPGPSRAALALTYSRSHSKTSASTRGHLRDVVASRTFSRRRGALGSIASRGATAGGRSRSRGAGAWPRRRRGW